MGRVLSTNWIQHFAIGFGVILVLLNVALLRQNLALRERVENLDGPSLTLGSLVPPRLGHSLSGEPFRLEPGKTERVLVLTFLSSDCPYTDIQYPYWCRLLSAFDPARLQYVGLVSESEPMEKVESYLRMKQCDLSRQTVVVNDDTLKQYRLYKTPTTLIVGGDGQVLKVWNGLWKRSEFQDALDTVSAIAEGPTEKHALVQ